MAQGEAVPTNTAISLSPDAVGSNGVYCVSDEAKGLALYQNIKLDAGSYDIGFDSDDTFNGAQQTHDAYFPASIAGVKLTSFDLASVNAGTWSSHTGKADITTAGEYLVAFIFDTPDYTINPTPPPGPHDAKNLVIDRVYATADKAGGGTPIPSAVPEPSSWAMSLGRFTLVGCAARRRRMRLSPG